jgi:TolB-like protein
MRTKGVGGRSVLGTTENRAKQCPASGRSLSSHSPVKAENRKLCRGLAAVSQLSCAPSGLHRLVSWKEVAGYLHCTIRSVQRWERGEGLPVHRHLHQRGSTVYAQPEELDAWLETRISLEASRLTAPELSTARERLQVLPFVNLGNDARLNLLCDGLTEEITFQLASLDPKRLGVISRTTSMNQKTSPKTIPGIGRKLGVTSVMEGCLRSSGSHIRITARLTRVSDQTQVWAECFDGEASDPLQFQLKIARQIVHSLHGRGLLPTADLSRPVAPTPPQQPLEHFQPGDKGIDASQDKLCKQNPNGSTGTRQELAGKPLLLGFVILLRSPKGFYTQELPGNIPC